ncbi:hypothetical protein B0H13DRAFT_2395197 [Mycena leptocephala]|nr:hypothetical protein B0H13DRAFT_2395197 [Mycena leptocephala]
MPLRFPSPRPVASVTSLSSAIDLTKASSLGAAAPRPLVVDLTQGQPSKDIQSGHDTDEPNLILFDDSLAFTITLTQLSEYKLVNGLLQDYSTSPPVDVFIFNDHVIGGKFKIHMGNFSIPGQPNVDPIAIAVKYLIGREEDTVAIWTEGARSADLQSYWKSFSSSCLAEHKLLPDIDVVAICLLTELVSGNGLCSLAQPWHFGHRFTMDTLTLDPEVWAVLSAFSHFTYQASNHSRVYVDFEGALTPTGGYRILDSRTHLVDVENNYSGQDSSEDYGSLPVLPFTPSRL